MIIMTCLHQIVLRLLYKIMESTKIFTKKWMPDEGWLFIKSIFPGQAIHNNMVKNHIAEWQSAREKHPWIRDSTEFPGGVNLVGYLRTVKGIGEAARSSMMALKAGNIPHTVNDFEFGIPAYQKTEPLPDLQSKKGFPFNTNLFHINPPQLPYLHSYFKKGDLISRYNIGVWYWELPEFPEEWCFAFGLVDEVWVATQFIFDSISAKTSVPVVKIPPCIDTIYNQDLNRSDFGLPAERFLFLCAYDVLSIQARKNPFGAVEAFKRAFPKNDANVGLVIKINNAAESPQEIIHLRESLIGFSNCYLIEDIFDKLKFNSLINLVDTYVSLHRSEGFGLIPAEAMSFGKPVIMTRWSGNLDLMTVDNSCGVDYKLIPIREQAGPYMPGQMWAEPDLDHAAFFMQKIYSDKNYYSQISEQARKTIQDNYSPPVIGQLMKERLTRIGLLS